ncbi:amidohydrolase family protein [Roseomonas sp. PWR1]|uniref:Amidohydrolase family protein n=1 Tax=Roseomonas nitratireducens TaxID=2820810 RepID=A0ABS4AVP3_9PROT|nr:amidohydrolase family protein [Neoroseomonas nitratireducens]MBP0465439.1 amidohydrolase family protein [Neoroseomonas nitratireducens]
MFDLLVRGGEILDGTGAPAYRGDVAVQDGRVAAIGADLPAETARLVLDAGGLTVAPGFIDIHTHSDFTLLVDGRADSQVCQGVTLEVIGQCGFSCAPFTGAMSPRQLIGFHDAGIDVTWRTFGDYLDRLDGKGLGVNVAAMVGHGAIRQAIKCDAVDATSQDELAAMTRLAEDAFDAGAFGLSTGLEYFPGNIAPIEEVQQLCAVCARRGGLYATHVRNRDIHYDLGFTEAVATARAAGARLQISHIQPKYGAPPHAMAHTLELLHRARREGVDVAFDIIPHDWSHTSVVASLPAWAREGGSERLLERLRDPALRQAMKHNPRPMWRLVADRRWDRIALLRADANPGLVGLTLREIGLRRNADPMDAVLDLLAEEGAGLGNLIWTSSGFDDADIRLCLEQAECAVMSDTKALNRDGPLADTIGSLSGYGWVARLLGHYVREEGVLSLPEAVRRITSLPAGRLGLADRGRIRPGAAGDLVVFDPAAVRDASDMSDPRRHPEGFVHVVLGGVPTLRDGHRTAANPGRVVRRPG